MENGKRETRNEKQKRELYVKNHAPKWERLRWRVQRGAGNQRTALTVAEKVLILPQQQYSPNVGITSPSSTFSPPCFFCRPSSCMFRMRNLTPRAGILRVPNMILCPSTNTLSKRARSKTHRNLEPRHEQSLLQGEEEWRREENDQNKETQRREAKIERQR